MEYKTFRPSRTLDPFVQCYWSLEGRPSPEERRQTILPDGCVDLALILGDDVRRHLADGTVLVQPRALVIGQMTEPFFIEPGDYVHTFGVRFYPYGFCNFVSRSLSDFADRETALREVFEPDEANELERFVQNASSVHERIEVVERFLTAKLREPTTLDRIARTTIDLFLASKGQVSLRSLAQGEASKLRRLERSFQKNLGISPKKLERAIRFQAALAMLLDENVESLSRIAYDNGYFDQSHFIHDFKRWTGSTPSEYGLHPQHLVSKLFRSAP